MAVMDKDTGKLLDYRQLKNSPNAKIMEPFISQKMGNGQTESKVA
jgi:hypothetical protein